MQPTDSKQKPSHSLLNISISFAKHQRQITQRRSTNSASPSTIDRPQSISLHFNRNSLETPPCFRLFLNSSLICIFMASTFAISSIFSVPFLLSTIDSSLPPNSSRGRSRISSEISGELHKNFCIVLMIHLLLSLLSRLTLHKPFALFLSPSTTINPFESLLFASLTQSLESLICLVTGGLINFHSSSLKAAILLNKSLPLLLFLISFKPFVISFKSFLSFIAALLFSASLSLVLLALSKGKTEKESNKSSTETNRAQRSRSESTEVFQRDSNMQNLSTRMTSNESNQPSNTSIASLSRKERHCLDSQ